MIDYTVEVVTVPVVNDDWSLIYRALDDIPGAVLLADPTEPTLMFPVSAESAFKAVQLIDGLATLIGLQIKCGKVYPSPVLDADLAFDPDGERTAANSIVEGLTHWVDQTPPPPKHLQQLVDA